MIVHLWGGGTVEIANRKVETFYDLDQTMSGCVYRHYKGGLYRVLHVGLLEKDQRVMVVYRSLFLRDVSLWTRPHADFISHVDGVRRFRLERKASWWWRFTTWLRGR